jgi:hypothetical protein
MTAPLTLVFAMPPSVNHVWQHGKHGSYKGARIQAVDRRGGLADRDPSAPQLLR